MGDRPDDIAIDYARGILMSARGRVDDKTVNATRVMARAFPDSYTTQLVDYLIRHSWFFRDHPDLQLPLLEEAVAAARQIKETEPLWPGLVIQAINSHASWYQARGRWAEAMEIFAELDRYRGIPAKRHRHPYKRGYLSPWATALAEWGRHAEALEIRSEDFDYQLALDDSLGLPEAALAMADSLEALGRFGEAVSISSTDQLLTRSKYGPNFCYLVHLARIHQSAGDHDARIATLEQAFAVLSSLPHHDDLGRTLPFGSSLSHYLACSIRADEPPRSDGRPGYSYVSWTPSLRQRFQDEAETLFAEAAALPHGPERVILHRRATVRLASRFLDQSRTRDRLAEPFDEGVRLAEEAVRGGSDMASELLARALLDRAQYRATCQDFSGAVTDFAAALDIIKG